MDARPPAYNPKPDETSVQMTQPLTGPGQTMTVVTSQPQTIIIQTTENVNVNMPRGVPRDWSTGLMGCFDDCSSCLLGTFFPFCYAGCVASEMGEPCCTACCAGTLAMRSNFRGKHNLQGSLISDCCTMTYCGPCAMCQIHRELENMKAGRAAP